MTFTLSSPTIGVPDVTAVTKAGAIGDPTVITQLPSVITEAKLGQVVEAWDSTLGNTQFILLAVPVSTTITAGLLYQFDKNYTVVLVPVAGTSKNTGVAVAIALNAVTSNATSIQYTWFAIRGQVNTLKTAVACSPQSAVYISATAGRVKFVSSAGQQILGARTQNTATVSSGQSTVPIYFNFSAIEGV